VTAALVVAACTAGDVRPDERDVDAEVYPAAQVDPLIAGVPSEEVAAPPRMRLADGLVPPTNTWFAGLVFGETPQPVFPFPISFALTDTGVTAGLPRPVVSATSIVAPAVTGATLDVGSEEARVASYDEVAVTIEHLSGGAVLGRTTVAQGSPIVSYTAAVAQTDRLGTAVSGVSGAGDGSGAGSGSAGSDGGARGTFEAGGSSWGVVVTGGRLDGASVELDADGSIDLVALPDGATAAQVETLLDAAASPLVGVRTAFGTTGADGATGGDEATRASSAESTRTSAATSTTTLEYETAAGGDTLVVPAPHQLGAGSEAAGLADTGVADTGLADTGLVYETIHGTVPLTTGSSLTFGAPLLEASAALDLGSLDESEREELRRRLPEDVASTGEFPTDTYYGGKALYRAAMLWQLAVQLGDDESAATLERLIVEQLDLWTDPDGCTVRAQQCFVYDPAVKGLVGRVSSFGSELFNDHHFHYGYLLTAAGVLGRDRPDLVTRWAPVMDLVAADIGSGSASGAFPDHRAFDPYWSHSWASGYSPFADGNNQESSSEAVSASSGLSLWAAARGDTALGAQATWMLSGEAAAALAYFVAPDLSDPVLSGYDHEIVSLNWGAKRDYATWFSAEPSAIAGIQLIPLDPTSVSYLSQEAAGGADRVRAIVTEAQGSRPVVPGEGAAAGGDAAGGDAAGGDAAPSAAAPLGDYVLMYSALAGPDEAAEALAAITDLPESAIDDGNSRTYALAYVMSAAAHVR
jgi:endo-1,3(4)-beta-glucanase